MRPGESQDCKVVQESLYRSETEGKALHYNSSARSRTVHTLVENSLHYRLENEKLGNWPEVIRCKVKTARVPRIFHNMALKMIEMLGNTRPQGPTTHVV